MRRFSIGAALGDAFALMRRRPLSVFVWGLLMVAPMLAMLAVMLPAMSAMAELTPAAAEAADGPSPQVFAQLMQVQAASMLANVVQMLMMAVIYTAIMRAVLRPADRSWFSLRVGMDELRVAVVGLAIGVGMYVVMMAVILLGAALGFAAWGAGIEPGPGVAVLVIAVVAVVLAFCWGLARVSLIAPASVLRRDFAFAEGWRLAKGKGWALLGLMIVIMLIILLIEIMLMALGFGLMAAGISATAADWTEAANPFANLSTWLTGHWYWVAAIVAVAALFYGWVLTLSVAPFASACRQLAESGRRDEGSLTPAA